MLPRLPRREGATLAVALLALCATSACGGSSSKSAAAPSDPLAPPAAPIAPEPAPAASAPETPKVAPDAAAGTEVKAPAPDPNIPVGLQVGYLAPDFEAVDMEGKRFKLSDYRGKVVALDFWGFW